MRTQLFSVIHKIFILSFLVLANKNWAKDIKTKSSFEYAYDLYNVKKYNAALNVLSRFKDTKQVNLIAENIIKGYVFTDSISFDEGKKYFERAERLLTNSNNTELKCYNFIGLGKGYFKQEDFNKSIHYFLSAELLSVKGKLTALQCTANYYLALNYQRIRNIPPSNACIKIAIICAKQLNDSNEIFNCLYLNASNYNFYLSADTSTFIYFDSIMKVAYEAKKYIKPNDYHQLAQLHNLYMKAYKAKDDFSNRKKQALISLKYYLKTNDTANIAGALVATSQAYLYLNQLDSALYYSKNFANLQIADSTLESHIRMVYYFNNYKIYSELKDTDKALYYLELYVYLNLDVEYNDGIRNLQMRDDFELEKTNQHIADEKAKTIALYEQKKNYYYKISGTFFLLLFILAYLIYYRFKSNKEKERKSLQIFLQNAELTALKAQMNPHFIFNSLNAIQHSIVTNNTDDAYLFLSKFSKLIRNVLDNSSAQVISLKTEIETLSLYIEIESKRFDHSFSFNLTIDANNYDIDKILIPPMIIQPCIENAIWHGLMPKEGDKNLLVNFVIESASTIICTIKDNGIGRERANKIAAEKGRTYQSKGISNIMERIKLLEMTHSIKVIMETIDEYDEYKSSNGTTVIVKFISQ